MSKKDKTLSREQADEAKGRRRVATHLQELEDNPLDAEQIAMFEMFDRENWSHEQRLAHIRRRAEAAAKVDAVAE